MRRLRLAPVVLLLALPLPGLAYTPGSGTLFTEDFDGALQPDWEMQDGYLGRPCPWTQVTDGADTSFYADGQGPLFNSVTRHWARHYVQPTPATAFSMAFEQRAAVGASAHPIFTRGRLYRFPPPRAHPAAHSGCRPPPGHPTGRRPHAGIAFLPGAPAPGGK